MARRGNGEGSVFKEPSGRYRAAITVMVNGKRKRITATAWKQAEAIAKLRELRTQYNPALDANKVHTVADLINRWMDKHCRAPADNPSAIRVARSTLDSRERVIRIHVLPRIGSFLLKNFSALDVEDFNTQLEKAKAGGSTCKGIWDVCRSAFKYGMKMSMVTSNPFMVVQCRKHSPKKMSPFTADEVNTLLEATAGTRNHAMLVAMFYMGMRQGEVFGLRWDRVNMQERYLIIDQQAVEVAGKTVIGKPKTMSSVRRLLMPDVVVEALRDHKAILMKEGNAGNPLVFPGIRGNPHSRSYFWADIWKPLLDHCGIEHRGAHNTRHTFASIALAAGHDSAVVSKILGHKTISTTLNIYAHAIPAKEDATVNKMQSLFG